MAKVRIGKSGLTVKVSLSFHEAAALHALLLRVDADTNPGINDATLGLFGALDQVRDDIFDQDRRLWPDEFIAFGRGTNGLVDPDRWRED